MRRWYVGDVMTADVVTATPDMGYKAVADLLIERSVSALPVIDAERHVLGVVSEADLLAKLEYADRAPRHPLAARRLRAGSGKAAGDTVAELMTAPAVTVRATETETRAARLMDAAGVKRLPVVDEDGRLVGIVSRRDLIRLYTRSDNEIRAVVAEGVLRGLWIDPAALNIEVRDGVVTLAGRVERRSTAVIAVSFIQATPGVVDVVDRLSYTVDDTGAIGHATDPLRARPEDVQLG